MQNYIEFTIQISEDYQEVVLADLFELGFSGFEQYPTSMKAFVDEDVFNSINTEEFLTILEPFGGAELITEKTIHQPKNWNLEWEKSIKPIQVGRFFIKPTWANEPTPDGLVELLIDPKMAFGTGYHETTRLMLHALAKYQKVGDSILDVGTGTGILAIAALKLGAKHAFGFDIDEWSSANATENAQLNNVIEGFEVKLGSFETVKDSNYDLVIANVNRSAILLLQNDIVKHAKKGGFILLSGLLTTEVHIIKQEPIFANLKLIQETSEGDWSGLVYLK